MRIRTIVAAALAAVIVIGAICTAKPVKNDVSDRIQEAIDAYKAARFDAAISILTDVSKDQSLDVKERRNVYLYLARSYVAKSNNEKVRNALTMLVTLEPPIIELDPDNESPPLMKAYYEVRKSTSGSTQVERADPGIKTMAILDFKNRSIDDKEKYDPMEKGFAELLINQLNGAVNLKVVERERIQWILDEIGLENDPGKFDEKSAVRVGKQLGVHTILIGNFIKANDQLYLGARLVKVETSEILMTDQVKGDADDFFDLTEELSKKVAKGINVTIGKVEFKPGKETKSLDAMLTYSEGLVLLEKGSYQQAYDKFMEALEIDPAYSKAKTKADSIKPLIG
jgi:TolB-like protein